MSQENEWIELPGEVIQGHRVAYGQSPDSPYPQGSVALQLPFFKDRGADFGEIHPATINVSISPYHFRIIQPDYFFPQVEWTTLHPPENFSFVACKISFLQSHPSEKWPAFIYYPHPETKKTHFSQDTILEILTGYRDGLTYGEKVNIYLDQKKVEIFR